MKGDSYKARVHLLTGNATNVQNNTVDFPLIDLASMKGRWTDIQILLDTTDDKELLEIFVDGERTVRYEDFITFVPEYYFFKYGLYRSFVSRHGGPIPTQVLFIDEVRMGSTMDAVDVDENRPVD